MRIISIYFQKFENLSNIEFIFVHPRYQSYVQLYFTKLENQAKVKLLKLLFNNDNLTNIIFGDDLRIAKSHKKIFIIQLALFLL